MDSQALRQSLGRFATGITVVTVRTSDDEQYGVTINSFTSVSLEPPLVSFALQRSSVMWGRIQRAGGYAVNVLSASQEELSNHFAGSRNKEPFGELPLLSTTSQHPLLRGCLAVFDCKLWREYDGGDHVLLLGEVLEFHAFEGEPLLYYRSRYATL